MAELHDGSIEDLDGHIEKLDGRLATALARNDDVEVRRLLSQMGKAEFDASAPKPIEPATVEDVKPS
jgi:hypothetical protein